MAPSPIQLLVVAFLVLLLFGAGRLSDFGKGLGEGIRNFKKGLKDEDSTEQLSGSDSDKIDKPSGK